MGPPLQDLQGQAQLSRAGILVHIMDQVRPPAGASWWSLKSLLQTLSHILIVMLPPSLLSVLSTLSSRGPTYQLLIGDLLGTDTAQLYKAGDVFGHCPLISPTKKG